MYHFSDICSYKCKFDILKGGVGFANSLTVHAYFCVGLPESPLQSGFVPFVVALFIEILIQVKIHC